MTVQGLDQLISNLAALSKTAVPRATAQAVNRVAGRAISRSSSKVSKGKQVTRTICQCDDTCSDYPYR
ncbi:Prophage minor tail protein Z (GPZ) [Yersinia intermedia]|uniref:phage tail protein n=1 Tax=Yersinia intermedia TaxID=631 RepID=UPI0005E5E155|nr:phage tail protein [Yersinia intermedia]CNH15883.1 Prophage minor tail protein Z (GPZ) [Yersinia intermedia]CQD77838.1 Prophage minor tail protein Z (GPZ) [Yersinia intermedia]